MTALADSAAILTKALTEVADTIRRDGKGYELSNWPGKSESQRYWVARRTVRDGVQIVSALDSRTLTIRVLREPPLPTPKPKPDKGTRESRVIGFRRLVLEPLDGEYEPGHEIPPERIPAHVTSR
jgi:hypothetical protein